MKTSQRIRIITMSLFALVTFGFASKSFAKSFPFQQIEIKNTPMKPMRVAIKDDGTFTVPGPLKAGSYTFTLIKSSSSTSSGDNPMESIAVSKITINLHIVSPPDPATGATTGRRQHSPMSIMKVTDATSANLFSKAASSTVVVGTGTLDEDCNGFTGKITFTYTPGGKTSNDDWTN